MKTGFASIFAAVFAGTCAAAQMTTPWGEKTTSENCWRDYPRPQMVRANWTCLNGDWDYAITAITNTFARPETWAGKIRVPFALEAPLSGCGGRLLKSDEYLWYTRELTLDPKPGEKILLHFGAVDFRAMVFLGHDEAGSHEGGDVPFIVDLTPFARKGANKLTVLVWDPTEAFVQPRGKQDSKMHSCFYTQVSGIWQTVWMETVPERYIKDYDVRCDIDKGTATFVFAVDGAGAAAAEEGVLEVAGRRAPFRAGAPATVELPRPVRLWSPEKPALYDFTARWGKDEISGYFAMRKFEKKKDEKGILRFFLNNSQYYIMATLDQGWWPDGLLTPPSEEAMAFDIETLKACGFNTMRKHIKVEPLRYYALCDRLGMLVLQDMPCPRGGGWQAAKNYGIYRAELCETIAALKKVPCIAMWIPYNEGWGQHDAFVTHATLDLAKRLDPSRLVGGPSGWNDREGGKARVPGTREKRPTAHLPPGECEAADTVDYHAYRGPAMPEVNDRRISFLGEFGGLGHPVPGHMWRETLRDGSAGGSKNGSWGYGGIEDTKTREGLESTYLGLMEKLGDFAAAGLAGSVYTQTTDVGIEVNGLMTWDRRVLKFDPSTLAEAHGRVIRRSLGK